MDDSIKLSKVLEQALAGKNVSQVARECDLPVNLLHDWKGGRLPSAKHMPLLRRLSRNLGLSLETLLFGDVDSETIVITSTTFNDNGNQYKVSIEKLKGSKGE